MEIYIADKKTLDEVKKDTTGILTKINNNKDEYVSAKNHSYVNNKIRHKFTTRSTKDYEILSVKCPNGGKLGYLHLEFQTPTDEVTDICITIKADGNVVKKICLGKDMKIAHNKFIVYTLKVQSVNLIALLDKWSENSSPDIKYFSQNKKLADVKMEDVVHTNTKGYIYDNHVVSTDDIFVDKAGYLDFNNLTILVSYNQKSSASLNPEFLCNYKAII